MAGDDTPRLRTPLGGALSAAVALGVFAAPWLLALWASLRDLDLSLSGWQPPDRDPVYLQEEPEPEPEVVDVEVDMDLELQGEAEASEVRPVRAASGGEAAAAEAVEDDAREGAPRGDGVEKTLRESKQARLARYRKARRAKCAKPHPHVRVGDDGVVEVDRSYVRQVTKNLKAFMELGYSRPHNEDGLRGWYISGFGCTSPVYKAGFRRRDVVLEVNGSRTRTWPQVYLLYQRLKRKDAFEVALMRRGERQTLRFRVVPDAG